MQDMSFNDWRLLSNKYVAAEAAKDNNIKLMNRIQKEGGIWSKKSVAKFTKEEKQQIAGAKDSSCWEIRQAAAMNTAATFKTLRVTAKDKVWKVRRSTALNMNCSRELLGFLLKDEKMEVREAAIKTLLRKVK